MTKLYLIGCFLVISLIACDDILQVTPETQVTFETAFETEKEIETGLLSVERYVRLSLPNTLQPGIYGEYSDYHTSANPALLNFNQIGVYLVHRKWHFDAIAMANVPLPYIDRVPMTQERRNFYKGQIYFTKALIYFDLGRRYKFTPIVRNEVEIDPIVYSSWEDVIDYAIEQAREAVALLPEYPDLRDSDGNVITRKSVPTKGAANALLAHLCAWKAGCKYMVSSDKTDYNEMVLWKIVDSACTAIIQQEDVYRLANTPEEVCTSVLVGDSPESIYEIQIHGYGNEMDGEDLASTFYCTGLYYQTWPVVSSESAGNIQYKDFRILAESVRNMYPTRVEHGEIITDLRRDAYFYELDSMQYKVDESITGGYAYPWKYRVGRLGTSGWDAGRFVNFDQNKIWFRLADIILLRAEARVRLGNTPGAIEDLNAIRSRAKAKLYDASEYNGDLRYAIFKEREKELLMENWRWYDVLRNGYYKTELYGGFREVSEQDIIDGCFLLGIPENEFTNNPLARQNTFWLKHQ